MTGMGLGVLAIALGSAGFGLEAAADSEWRHVEDGASRTVKMFYQQLLGEKCPGECARVLAGERVFLRAIPPKARARLTAQDPTEAVWEYLRQNRRLFLLAGVESAADVPRIPLRYVVTSLDSQSWKEAASVGVVAFHVARLGGKAGVFKEVFFPLEDSQESPTGYGINLPGVRVNGIGLDPAEDRDRSENLYELLGFR